MLTQDKIEQFFLKMVEEMRKENIPIMNDYFMDFKDYPYEEEIREREEKERKEDIEEGYYVEEDHVIIN